MSSYFAIGYCLHLIIVLLACQRRKAMRGAEELSLHPPGWETGLQSSQAEPSPRGLPGHQRCEELPCSPRWAGEDAKGFPNFMPSSLLLEKQARGGGKACSRPGTCPQLHFPGRGHHVCDWVHGLSQLLLQLGGSPQPITTNSLSWGWHFHIEALQPLTAENKPPC